MPEVETDSSHEGGKKKRWNRNRWRSSCEHSSASPMRWRSGRGGRGEIKPDAKEVNKILEDFEAGWNEGWTCPLWTLQFRRIWIWNVRWKEANNFERWIRWVNGKDFEVEEAEKIVKEPSLFQRSFAFEAFTSQEETKTFNWNHSGSTYYNEPSGLNPEAEAEMAEGWLKPIAKIEICQVCPWKEELKLLLLSF